MITSIENSNNTEPEQVWEGPPINPDSEFEKDLAKGEAGEFIHPLRRMAQ